MFNNFIKVFHDGILFAETDNIVYTNRQLIEMFNLIPQKPK